MKALGKWIRDATRRICDPDHELRVQELAEFLYKSMQTEGDKFTLGLFKRKVDCTANDLDLATRRVYQLVVARAWKDNRVTEIERKQVDWVVSKLLIPTNEVRSLELSIAQDRFANALSVAMEDGNLDEAEAQFLSEIAKSVGFTLGDFVRTYFRNEGEHFLRGIFAGCTEGGVLAHDAWTRLSISTTRLGLSKAELLSAIRLQAERFVQHVIADAKSDGEITKNEETVLLELIHVLNVSAENREYVIQTINTLRTIGAARRGTLPSLKQPKGIATRSGEIIHYHAPATWLQKKMLKSGDRWDEHKGTLTVTDNRLLFSGGTKSFDVKFGRIVSYSGKTGTIRLQRMEKPETIIRVVESDPVAFAIFDGAICLANQTRLAPTEVAPNRSIPREVRQRVWQRDGARCVDCGATEYLEYDHIIPVAKGGSNFDANIQLLCRRCNAKKSDAI